MLPGKYGSKTLAVSPMNEPAVSVIIPTYNRAAYIVECLESVLNQTVKPHEVIVIDNGSTDDTEDRLKPFLKRITYLKIPAAGRPSVPRNVGLKKATGEIIAFQDSDDIWMPTKIEDQIGAMADPDIILSYGNAEIIDSEGKNTGTKILAPGVGKNGWIFKELLNTNFVSTLTVMARRDRLLAAGGFNEAKGLVEDWELWLRLSRVGQFKYIDKPLAYYRRHGGTISSALDDGTDNYIMSVYYSILKQPLKSHEKAAVYRRMAGLLFARTTKLAGWQKGTALMRAAYRLMLAKLFALLGRLGIK